MWDTGRVARQRPCPHVRLSMHALLSSLIDDDGWTDSLGILAARAWHDRELTEERIPGRQLTAHPTRAHVTCTCACARASFLGDRAPPVEPSRVGWVYYKARLI
jgi:hypothetical protein